MQQMKRPYPEEEKFSKSHSKIKVNDFEEDVEESVEFDVEQESTQIFSASTSDNLILIKRQLSYEMTFSNTKTPLNRKPHEKSSKIFDALLKVMSTFMKLKKQGSKKRCRQPTSYQLKLRALKSCFNQEDPGTNYISLAKYIGLPRSTEALCSQVETNYFVECSFKKNICSLKHR